ncbi:DUF3237 domain-containing protein [Aspergillus puulaauensis]|uniref:Uncharacterized protein n=1 Tax=Aspergillus puulaauensis TaxID=1220207 RepID=A0A7R7XTJ9_9EURO|nr:uncharacterized protein APUU_60292S [Aspergillus puulaauensis]BCS27244.1 hypothetical protein APUU_60292S [Aspergillus puulaauensis]
MFTQLRNFVVAALTIQSFTGSPVVSAASPQPPELSYLYTAFVYCKGSLMNEDGPRGIRRAIPIVGGNFTGPRLSGSILDVGADWGTVDPKTEIFSADTRYNLRTGDGADIFVQTSGPKAPSGNLHLRLVFETGHENYYWLNNVVGEFCSEWRERV